MNERNESRTETLGNTRVCKFRISRLYALGAFLFICIAMVSCDYSVPAIRQQKPVMLAPHEIAIKNTTCILMNRPEEAYSYYADWLATGRRPDKKRAIEASKEIHKKIHHLNRELGPVEILENETFNEATRVVVPILSGKFRNLAADKIGVVNDFVEYVLERRETAEGHQWIVISSLDPNYADIESTWLKLPRKKVPGSPRIILKKAILMQAFSDDGKIVGEKTILFDEKIENIGTVVEE